MPVMAKARLPHLHRERTRHGDVIWYVRVDRGRRTRIRGRYGSDEFMAAYRTAVLGGPPTAPKERPEKDPRTLAWLVQQWMRSSDWGGTKVTTRRQRENFLHHVLEANGSAPFDSIKKEHMVAGRERRQKTPFAANNFIKTMRALFRWAVASNLLETDPTLGVAFIKTKTDGFRAWTMDDAVKFRQRWLIGTRERVAFEVLLNTGLRRGDAARLGRQHVKDGVATLRAEKTGVELFIPILPSLQRAIEAGPTGDLTFICGANGRPMVKESFGNWFKTSCVSAGVEGSAHGVRKLSATLIANEGGSEKELQALFGWQTNEQSAVYTRSADKRQLAIKAARKLAKAV